MNIPTQNNKLMRRVIAFAVFSLIIIGQNVYGQEMGYWSIQYSTGFGNGDLGEFISNSSFRGGLVEYRKPVRDNLYVGADIGWNVFYEKKDADTYTLDTESLSGVQYRTQNIIPILASAEYLFSTENALKPYIGIGIGTMYTDRTVDMGQWRFQQNPWSFALRPELGFLYEMSSSSSFKLAAKYYNGFKTSELETQGYFSVSAGIAIHL
jgi:opacity protein-like surface antigen